jgi:DNA modification methylase
MPNIEIVSEEKMQKKFLLLNGNSKDVLKEFPDNCVQTVVTSPPYWQLRDYFVDDQLGQEETPEEYVKNLVEICEEIKRVLRKDGIFWLNIGDGYNNSFKHPIIKNKDLVGMPWRVGLALQEAGWYLRCDIIFSKTNPMPDGAKDRPTRGHEYIFLLTKSPKYFYDYYGVLEETEKQPEQIQGFGANEQHGTYRMDQERTFEHYGKRNKRSVWEFSVSNFKGNHFATFNPKLIEHCIKSSTSEKGCCVECGTPWCRIFEKEKIPSENKKGYNLELSHKGWEKGCNCETDEVKKCIVLDPFNGSGTTGIVSLKYDNNYIGIDINKEYLDIARSNIKETNKKGNIIEDYSYTIKEMSSLENFLNE